MITEKLNAQCISCLLDKHLESATEDFPSCKKIEYMQGILKIIGNANIGMSAPEIVEQIESFKQSFGITSDFSQIKSFYNQLMLSFEKEIEVKIENSENPLKAAVKYAMAGNYIDFGAMKSVDEQKLKETLENADKITIKKTEFERFEKEIKTARNIVYLTDNCGEIVLDKLLIRQISRLNGKAKINVIVRGEPVLNDCIVEDAKQTGLDKLATVIGNGTRIAGTCLDKISSSAKDLIDNADIIISKGQGNFETLRFCGKNIYYLFLCKCKMFAERFKVNRFEGIFINDKRM